MNQEITSIHDLPAADRAWYDRWLDEVRKPRLSESEVDELARLDAMRHPGCWET